MMHRANRNTMLTVYDNPTVAAPDEPSQHTGVYRVREAKRYGQHRLLADHGVLRERLAVRLPQGAHGQLDRAVQDRDDDGARPDAPARGDPEQPHRRAEAVDRPPRLQEQERPAEGGPDRLHRRLWASACLYAR